MLSLVLSLMLNAVHNIAYESIFDAEIHISYLRCVWFGFG